MRHHRLGAGGARLGLAPRQPLGRERGAAMSSGKLSGVGVTPGIESHASRVR